MQKADVLILSNAIGSGHMRASAALTQGIQLLAPERECLTIDFPREVSPAMEALLRRAYLESLKLVPTAYGRVYRMSELGVAQHPRTRWASDAYERMSQISELWAARHGQVYGERGPPEAPQRVTRRSGMKTLGLLAEESGAKVLVVPHFYGAGVLGNYKEQNPEVFAAVVLTDCVPHPIGVPRNLDLYIVADEAAAEKVEKLRVPQERIYPTGIPIDPAFEDPRTCRGFAGTFWASLQRTRKTTFR